MRILFIGGLFNEKQQEEVYQNSKNMPHMAANVHQWNIVNGLKDGVDIINPLFVGNFPKEYRKVYLKRETWSHRVGCVNVSPSTINIFGIKQMARLLTLTKEIVKWKKANVHNGIILVYSMNTSFLMSLQIAQLLCGKTKTCLIIPDLPLFYIQNSGKGIIYRALKTIDWKLMKLLSQKMDGYIMLTEQMGELLGVEERPHIVCEGICVADEDQQCFSDECGKTITYTGTLDKEFGVLSLVANFTACAEPDWILNIAGDGNARKEIEQATVSDDRIRYFGILTNNEAKELQKHSRVLVNPRSSDEEFTKYSFPSKTMEYLKSGRPVIMHHLSGVPDDYDPYLTYFSNTSDKAMQQGLMEIMAKSNEELDKIGMNGKRFVDEHKNSHVQGEKIRNFLVSLFCSHFI